MNKRGITLVEVMIVVAIIGIVVAIVFAGLSSYNQSAQAEDAARDWAHKMGIKVHGVNCVDRDSDGDGYVSCTISEDREDGTKTHSVECASSWSWNSGCRVPKLGLRP